MVACTNHLLKVGFGLDTPGHDVHKSRTSTEQKLTPDISCDLLSPLGSHLVILGGNSLVSKSFVNFALENSPEKMPPLENSQVSLFALIIPERGHTVN